jgi:hypothetical protein
MSETTKRVIISCSIILAVICLCASILAIASALGLFFTRTQGLNSQITESPQVDANPTTPEPNRVMTDAEIQAKMDNIAQRA